MRVESSKIDGRIYAVLVNIELFVESGSSNVPKSITQEFGGGIAWLKSRVSPVEKKTSGRYSTKSLERFRIRFDKQVVTELQLHPNNVMKEGNRITLPLNMAHLI